MDGDLTEIALNALEAAESSDEQNAQEESGAEDTGSVGESSNEPVDNKETGEEDNSEENGKTEEEDDDSDEDNSADDTSSDSEHGDSTEESDGEVEKKKELSDEEFEEMARKRGYSKAPAEDDKAKEEEEKAQIEKLTRKPSEISQEDWDATPQNNKMVYNSLPIITARGKDGQTVNVKLPQQLPEEFQFADDKARAEFNVAMQEQNNRINSMLGALNARDERIKQDAERRKEAQTVVDAVAKLQESGALPTPKAKYGSDDFNSDPAVKTINNVLQYRAQRMQQGISLTVEDALVLYKAQHPDEFKNVAKEPAKAKGDEERKQVAKKIAGGKKSTNKTANDNKGAERRYYKYGMSTQDVLDRALGDLK